MTKKSSTVWPVALGLGAGWSLVAAVLTLVWAWDWGTALLDSAAVGAVAAAGHAAFGLAISRRAALAWPLVMFAVVLSTDLFPWRVDGTLGMALTMAAVGGLGGLTLSAPSFLQRIGQATVWALMFGGGSYAVVIVGYVGAAFVGSSASRWPGAAMWALAAALVGVAVGRMGAEITETDESSPA